MKSLYHFSSLISVTHRPVWPRHLLGAWTCLSVKKLIKKSWCGFYISHGNRKQPALPAWCKLNIKMPLVALGSALITSVYKQFAQPVFQHTQFRTKFIDTDTLTY